MDSKLAYEVFKERLLSNCLAEVFADLEAIDEECISENPISAADAWFRHYVRRKDAHEIYDALYKSEANSTEKLILIGRMLWPEFDNSALCNALSINEQTARRYL